jgi:hypothetical protein
MVCRDPFPDFRIHVTVFPRARLEIFNLRQNQLDGISGLASLSSLIALNIGE